MKKTTMTGVAILGVILFGGSLGAQPKEQRVRDVPKTVKVAAENELAARNAARIEAVKAINAAMEGQRPPLLTFLVDEKYVEANKLLDNAARAGNVKVRELIDGKEHIFKEWEFRFRTDMDWWSDIVKKDREIQAEMQKQRAQEREQLSVRIMIGLAILLLAGYGYVKLDEYTKRRYTTWLRLAGVGAAVTLVATWLGIIAW